jgi:hypothetical protein
MHTRDRSSDHRLKVFDLISNLPGTHAQKGWCTNFPMKLGALTLAAYLAVAAAAPFSAANKVRVCFIVWTDKTIP